MASKRLRLVYQGDESLIAQKIYVYKIMLWFISWSTWALALQHGYYGALAWYIVWSPIRWHQCNNQCSCSCPFAIFDWITYYFKYVNQYFCSCPFAIFYSITYWHHYNNQYVCSCPFAIDQINTATIGNVSVLVHLRFLIRSPIWWHQYINQYFCFCPFVIQLKIC